MITTLLFPTTIGELGPVVTQLCVFEAPVAAFTAETFSLKSSQPASMVSERRAKITFFMVFLDHLAVILPDSISGFSVSI
ncbi:hypothetical protein CAZ10_09990 [Pseudomonas aeruginosa]|uniref:Uncharacterized protein n=1 Tax=Pseudomonas aeruginosa TaxID=287 RepID=A0A241XS35_PSEAI|nr:hypothetical protein CAZ10_09990 [Pseudomonas aeruginosa]